MTSRRIAAVGAALILGMGTAAACGRDSGDRESVEQGNQGEQNSEGGRTVIETGPTTLGSTGTQPSVTQEEDPE